MFRGYLKHTDILDDVRHSFGLTDHQVDFKQTCVKAELREV
jgi:hypothetical protein